MPATKRLVLDLPEAAVDAIEAEVASGRYADAAAAVASAVLDRGAVGVDWEDTPEFKAWLAEGDEIERQMESGEDPGIPAEQVFVEIKADLHAMIEAESEAR